MTEIPKPSYSICLGESGPLKGEISNPTPWLLITTAQEVNPGVSGVGNVTTRPTSSTPTTTQRGDGAGFNSNIADQNGNGNGICYNFADEGWLTLHVALKTTAQRAYFQRLLCSSVSVNFHMIPKILSMWRKQSIIFRGPESLVWPWQVAD